MKFDVTTLITKPKQFEYQRNILIHDLKKYNLLNTSTKQYLNDATTSFDIESTLEAIAINIFD